MLELSVVLVVILIAQRHATAAPLRKLCPAVCVLSPHLGRCRVGSEIQPRGEFDAIRFPSVAMGNICLSTWLDEALLLFCLGGNLTSIFMVLCVDVTRHVCKNKYTMRNRQKHPPVTMKEWTKRNKFPAHAVRLMQHLPSRQKGHALPGETLGERRLSQHICLKNTKHLWPCEVSVCKYEMNERSVTQSDAFFLAPRRCLEDSSGLFVRWNVGLSVWH